MTDRHLIVAIDGTSSTGKSTFAKLIAKDLGLIYVDSGAMYRAVALYCTEQGLFKDTEAPEASEVVKFLPEMEIQFKRNSDTGLNETYLGSRCVEREIRTLEIAERASFVSAIPEVRVAMVALQRKIGTASGVTMDGRDIGTVVYPNADIKIFMTASDTIRAERRRLELEKKGIPGDLEGILENIRSRDKRDSGRAASPLRQAGDAILLDNSHMSLEEQMEWFHETFREVING